MSLDSLLKVILSIEKLKEIDEELGFNGESYAEKYFPKNKNYTNEQDWWNSLDNKLSTESNRLKVGELAIHFGKMSANYKWSLEKWNKISNSQKKIVKFVFCALNDKARFFDIKNNHSLYA